MDIPRLPLNFSRSCATRRLVLLAEGVRPGDVRSNPPLLPRVAAMKEAEERRTTPPQRTPGTPESAREPARVRPPSAI